MDYLFYGNVTISRKTDETTVSLNIHCEPDETLHLYELAPNDSHRLAYRQVPTQRHPDGVAAIFDVQNNQLFLFTISGQSNESDIPFEVTYAVYNGEVIPLPENNVIQLEGSTYVFADGERKMYK